MNILKYGFIGLLFALLTGCATSIPLSQQARAQLHVVKVSSVVNMPASMQYNAPGGGFKGQSADTATRGLLMAEKRGKFTVNGIVAQEMRRAINESGSLRVARSASAVMYLKVVSYGFAGAHLGFSSKINPVISLQAKLVKNGKVIWQHYNYSFSLSSSGTTSYTVEQLQQNPALLRKIWQQVSYKVAKELVNNLVGR